jgi:hypothetical protein
MVSTPNLSLTPKSLDRSKPLTRDIGYRNCTAQSGPVLLRTDRSVARSWLLNAFPGCLWWGLRVVVGFTVREQNKHLRGVLLGHKSARLTCSLEASKRGNQWVQHSGLKSSTVQRV